ncbi:MAG: AIM24 family protein [Chloroflexaceae bacterium]
MPEKSRSSRGWSSRRRLIVSTGNLAAFADGVDDDIQTVGSVARALFGGEGEFMIRLTGPGRVLLQSLKRGVGTSSSGGSGD